MAGEGTPARGRTPDLILFGGVIQTLDQSRSRYEALAISDGHITALGGSDAIRQLAGPQTNTIDLRNACVLPGLADAHLHLRALGQHRSSDWVRIDTGWNIHEIARAVQSQARRQVAGSWIRGSGWTDGGLGEPLPTHHALSSATPTNPVWLEDYGGHSGLANAEALRLAHITRDTRPPRTGEILRDSSGEPTGVFRETAAMSSVGDAFPPSDEQVAGWLVAAQDACLAVGLTEIHDPGHHTLPERDLPALRDLADKGHLKLRVRHMIRIPELESHSWPSHAPSPFLSDMLTARCIKLFADGSLGNRGAALLAPYRDEPSQRGSLLLDEDDLAWALNESANRGFQVAVHAIGDRANRLVLDTVQHVRATNPGAAERLRIEHAQVLSREDIARFAALGAIASIQPVHAVEDKDFAEERLGGRRLRGAYAWRKLIRAGARIACGSDYPYGASEYRPLVGIHAAVTRQRPDRDPPRGWRPHEKMTLEEAVRGFSVGPAYAAFEERTRGVIASGRWADLTVLDRDPFGVTDPRILLKAQVRMTIVGGQVVYEPTT